MLPRHFPRKLVLPGGRAVCIIASVMANDVTQDEAVAALQIAREAVTASRGGGRSGQRSAARAGVAAVVLAFRSGNFAHSVFHATGKGVRDLPPDGLCPVCDW